MGIYLADMMLLIVNLIFCCYIVIRYVCRNKELRVGYIYYFYAFAIIISAIRFSECVLVFTHPSQTDIVLYEDINESAQLTTNNLLDRLGDNVTFVFGCVIVFSIYLIQQKLQGVDSNLTFESEVQTRNRCWFFCLLLLLNLMFILNNVLLFLAPLQIYTYELAWIVNSIMFGLLALIYMITFVQLDQRMTAITRNESL